MPSIMYKFLVNPPAHKGPKMVARPPTERLIPWLNPFGQKSQRFKDYSFTVWRANTACIFLYMLRCDGKNDLQTLRFLSCDFGEERHLRNGHEGEPQKLEKHSNDEGRQLPSITTWQGWEDNKNEINGVLNYCCLPPNYIKHLIKQWHLQDVI